MYHFVPAFIPKPAILCIAMVLVLTGSVMAETNSDTRTQSFNVGGLIQSAPSSGGFTLPDFNSALGTLESVTLTLNICGTTAIQVYNLSTSSESFQNASLTQQDSVTAPGLVLSPSITSLVGSGVAQPGLNTYPVDSSQTASGTVSPLTFALWQDQPGGVVAFTFTKGDPTFKGTDVGGNDLLFGGNLTGTGKVSVEYSYLAGGTLAVPEPTGKFLTMLVAAAMLILAFGRNLYGRA